MSRILTYLFLIFLLGSCMVNNQRKTANYYFKNQVKIEALLNTYENLYQKQPFALGFSDRRFNYYTLQLYTDTVRYIYNTKTSRQNIFDEIIKTPISNKEFLDIAQQIKDVRCLWIDKYDYYIQGEKHIATFMSFKSVLFKRSFEENKYYVLVFLNRELPLNDDNEVLKRYRMTKIKDGVYFGIRDKFR